MDNRIDSQERVLALKCLEFAKAEGASAARVTLNKSVMDLVGTLNGEIDKVSHCLDRSIAKIESAILTALENTPPELYADIVHNGIYLAGGGALLRGLSKRLYDKINIPFHVADEPLLSVAKGTGIALKNVERFTFLMR